MTQIAFLIDALKKTLRSRGFTYRDVATGLKLSEASIKRLFATGNFTLLRLDSICRLMGMDISDLVKMADAQIRRIDELTQEQEAELVSDVRLLLVAFLVVNNWRFDEILQSYHLTKPELIRCLTKLDKLKMIELLPGNRIKLLVSPSFAWRRNGPIQIFFTERMQEDFFHSRFDSKGEAFLFASGMLSQSSITELMETAERLVIEFNNRNRDDAILPLDQRFPHSLVLAIRPWRPSVFSNLRRV